MEDYEKLGSFYLGRQYDLKRKKGQDGLILYDAKDLVTHAVCVGMTGSGKTGLCIGLLEEAALDNIPAIVIDPKGDLTNLMLTFPELKAEDFAPWVNEDDARRKNISVADFAQQQAELWKSGLTSWRQDGERIKRLRQAADFVIYTPGSTAGLPVSILKSFAAPPPSLIEDNELLRDRINTTVTGLLGLLGIDADPIKSREHILISTILDNAWRNSLDMDLASLIQQIQNPPVTRVGVLDLESFYSSKDRFALALSLNNLLAAPGFNTWLEGDALDIGAILHSAEGKPKVSIFSIAHLNDAERMFFVSLLLNQILGWMRTQSGTTSLRAIVYMDEIFGYFPPVANPPSKTPLLTLLKQARAFGVGIVLVTQNPVDLDYKGLANTGTWFIGRLQTERDKARVLEGLEGAAASTNSKFNRQEMEQLLSGLSNRIFLLNNSRLDAPVIMETRWAMSYLRGPLTRNQIKVLMDPIKKTLGPAKSSMANPSGIASSVPLDVPVRASAAAGTNSSNTQSPVLPPDVPQYFVPLRGSRTTGTELVYYPAILGAAQVHFSDTKTGIDITKGYICQTAVTDEPVPVNWDNAKEFDLRISDLEKGPSPQAGFGSLPTVAGKSKNYDLWSKDFAGWLYRTQKLELLKSPSLKSFSNPGESDRDFRVRLQHAARERRDDDIENLRQKYAPKIAALEERVRRAQQVTEREAEQAKQQKVQTAISFGATLLGAFVGSKPVSYSTLGRATTAARGVSRSIKEQQDIERAQDTKESLEQRLQELEAEFKAETDEIAAKVDPMTEELQTVSIRPSKTDISITLVALCWLPYWKGPDGKAVPAM